MRAFQCRALTLALCFGALACSKTAVTTEATPGESPQSGDKEKEARVIAAMKSMRPSDLRIELDLKADLKAANAALDTVKNSGSSAAHWIEASFQVKDAKAVVFEARGDKKLNVEKDLGQYTGPVKGDYKHEDEVIAVNWYTFGRIDLGVDPSDDSYLVVRVRR